jgi:hypothetical protein
MLEGLTTLVTGIVIAVVSAWITVQLSLRRYRTERWWERKVQAYERVIGALHDAKAFAEDHLNAEYRGRDLSKEEDEKLRARSKVAQEEIAKAIDMGAFLLSDEALERLKQYRKDENKTSEEQSWVEYLDADRGVTDNCLKDLIRIAKKDLQIR